MKKFKGVIVSTKMDKTVVVSVKVLRKHRKYPKFIKRTRKFLADTNGLKLQVGDNVIIAESRPISKKKAFKVVEILKK